jgi:hypothetical protein
MTELFNLFDEIGLPYFRQGSLSDEEYQPKFFTYWNIDSPRLSYYDNKSRRWAEYIQIGFYTNDADLIYSVMEDFIRRAEEKGFLVEGKPKDANADKKGYFGRVCYIRIIHKGE